MDTTRRNLALGLAAGSGLTALASPARAGDEPKGHRLSIQVSANDPPTMNLALNTIVNVASEFSERAEDVEIELVAFGPGLHMLREDTSPVKPRLKSIRESMPNVTFSACGNTVAAMTKAEGKPTPIVPQARVVKAGVLRLMELQDNGWSYIRP